MTGFARSSDGTTIAYAVGGAGPPLVLVHGTGDSRARWASTMGELARRFRFYAMDRRGHGDSEDGAAYALEREFEDVAAVAAAAAAEAPPGTPVYLLGHSFGGICALEAARQWGGVAKLVLYEPPIPVGEEPIDAGHFRARIERRVESGDLEGVWETFLAEAVGVPKAEIERLRFSPTWAAHVATARLLPREMKARADYRFDPERFRSMAVPTLLLAGTESLQPLREPTLRLAEALPESRVVELSGQGHVAMSTAPDLFVRALVEFLAEPATSSRRASRQPRSSAARS